MSKYNRLNSTSTLLVDGASYNGYSEYCNKQGVLVSCKTDQDGVLTLFWSEDGVNFDFTDVFNIVASTPFSLSTYNRGQYFKLSLLNNSGSDQTYLRLFSRFIDDVPDSSGNVQVTAVPSVQQVVWNNVGLTAGDFSPTIDLNHITHLELVGNSIDSTVIKLWVSVDNSTFLQSSYTINAVAIDTFHLSILSGMRYLRLQSVSDTANMYLAVGGKG